MFQFMRLNSLKWCIVLSGKGIKIGDYSGEIIVEEYNKLIRRREVLIKLYHTGVGTPPRSLVRSEVAKLYNVDQSQVYVKKIESEYGAGVTEIHVHIYDDPRRASIFEPEYLVKRHG